LIDEDALGDQVTEFASYLARKFENKDDVELVAKPVDVLTPLFLENLKSFQMIMRLPCSLTPLKRAKVI
jgi:hypothetical protein